MFFSKRLFTTFVLLTSLISCGKKDISKIEKPTELKGYVEYLKKIKENTDGNNYYAGYKEVELRKMINKKKVCVFGLGYIGLPTSLLLAKSGFKVFGIDTNKKVITYPLVRNEFYKTKTLKINNDKFRLLIVGGSQGASIFDKNLKKSILNISKKFSIKYLKF